MPERVYRWRVADRNGVPYSCGRQKQCVNDTDPTPHLPQVRTLASRVCRKPVFLDLSNPRGEATEDGGRFNPTESVCKVVLQKSIPAQILQHILYCCEREALGDGFVQELTFSNRLSKPFL